MPDALPPRRDQSDPDTWRLARHEAGHAVAAVALRRPFDHVTIRPPDRRYRGMLVGHRTRPAPLAGAVVLLAGSIAAEENPDRAVVLDHFARGGRHDLRIVESLGRSDACIELLVRRAWRIVHGTHGEAVAAVATALVAHPEQRLNHQQVVDIVKDNRPGGLSWLLQRSTEQLAEEDVA
jgi:hypothetical protein